jgi:hypothetical protein
MRFIVHQQYSIIIDMLEFSSTEAIIAQVLVFFLMIFFRDLCESSVLSVFQFEPHELFVGYNHGLWA